MTQYAFGRGRQHRRKPRFDRHNPQAVAICDGCGFLVQHVALAEQKEYRGGTTPVGTGMWKCASCIDVPQPYYSRLLLKPDPVPVKNPRPDFNPSDYIILEDSSGIILSEDERRLITEAGGTDGGVAENPDE